MADPRRAAAPHPLWFSPPDRDESHRRALTRQHVIAEALAVISADGVNALSMRALAARLGVVPGALYRHVRSKEQLYDLVLDDVLAEVDCQADHSQDWAGQATTLAQRLRAVLENHPGVAGLLKTRDPLSPHSLALAEAFLTPLHGAGMPKRQAALAFRLIYDYTLGFALSAHQRQRAATPGRRDQAQAARVPAVTAPRPVPRASRPRRARLAGRPRRAVHRQYPHPHPRPAGSPARPPPPPALTPDQAAKQCHPPHPGTHAIPTPDRPTS